MDIGKIILLFGVVLVVMGLLYSFTPFGKLPGDINAGNGNFRFHFPIVSSIILSIILTLAINFFTRR